MMDCNQLSDVDNESMSRYHMWRKAFDQVPDSTLPQNSEEARVGDLNKLKQVLDHVHIKLCLLKPFFEINDYPIVKARELLPSFEVDHHEHDDLPGFSMVAFERPLSPFDEIFQYDALHPFLDWHKDHPYDACHLESDVADCNLKTMQSRLGKQLRIPFAKDFEDQDICAIESYENIMPYLLQLDRGHVLALDNAGHFCLSGIYASFPSDLDTELKRFGISIGKFSSGDNLKYELNRLFVYQFLMELHGFPIVSERRTSAALFARKLQKSSERFMIRVLGQSDRTITTLSNASHGSKHPIVEKTTLIQVDDTQEELFELLDDQGFFVDKAKRVVIVRVSYAQHEFNPKNLRKERALSVIRQEIIHPRTARVITHLNIIKDTSSLLLRLNDICRGEYSGTITYKRFELIEGTKDHADRLKFLYSWLSKHQRRIIAYSDDFFSKAVSILDGYLLSSENFDSFDSIRLLHQEVWSKYSYIQQARKVKILEDISQRTYKGRKLSYEETLSMLIEILSDLKYDLVNFFEELVQSALDFGNDILTDRYLITNYVYKKDRDLTGYGLKIKKMYGRLVSLLDEITLIQQTRLTGSSLK